MNKTLKTSIVFVIVGIDIAWLGMVLANYAGLLESPEYNEFGVIISGYDSLTKASTYIFLLALAGFALFSGLAYRMADHEVVKKTKGSLPVFSFTSVAVVVALVSLAIFAISAFFASFNFFSPTKGVGDQLLGVYLPIVLAAAICVVLLLSATVYRKSEVKVEAVSQEEKKAKREAALAFVYPIVGTTIALLIGLTVYSARRENPQVWIWVLILTIVGGSIAMGTIYAARTKSSSPKTRAAEPKKSGTAALTLNLVLVVIFIVVVTLMSFTFGIAAIQDLRQYLSNGPEIRTADLEWFTKLMLPAVVILAITNLTTSIAVRIRSIVASK
jgi:NADH:ubiquinone oxidoreductase subunit 5 (subunit L)/multisubunit Na+/H+ antiporter MnhA subunit